MLPCLYVACAVAHATCGFNVGPAEDGGAAVRANSTLQGCPPCGHVGKVAILATGYVKLTAKEKLRFHDHVHSMAEHVVKPLDADVISVFETGPCESSCVDGAPEREVVDALRQAVGQRLRAVGIVKTLGSAYDQSPATGVYTELLEQPPAQGNAYRLYDRSRANKGATKQWYKLREAWRLMEGVEARRQHGEGYDVVIKLRFDLIPGPAWRLCARRDSLEPFASPAIHAMTDKAFWGRRDVMAVAAQMYDAIPYFEGPGESGPVAGVALGEKALHPRPDPMRRPVAIRALLLSLLSLPPASFRDWTLYSKLQVLNVPDMGVGRPQVGSRNAGQLKEKTSFMVQSLRRALRAGISWVDPAWPAAPGTPPLVHIGSGPRDYAPALFVTEKDFIDWMLLHNVTVCDLGAETAGVLTKTSRWKRRAAMNGCVLADVEAGVDLRHEDWRADAAREDPVHAMPAIAPPSALAGEPICTPPPEQHAVQRAAGSPAPDLSNHRLVGILFTGNFIRRTRGITRPVQAILSSSTGADPGPVLRFEAFVATSTQHSESDACEALDGEELANILVHRGGFARAEVDCEPYDASTFIQRATRAGLPWRDGMRFPQYPHRVLSAFSTWRRAVHMVIRRESEAGITFHVLAVTRIYVLFECIRGIRVAPAAQERHRSWWEAVSNAGAIGRRRLRPDVWEDRFIIGRRDVILSLADLEARFPESFREHGNQSWPERHIAAHFERLGTLHTSKRAGPFFDEFVQISGFVQNRRKYSAAYMLRAVHGASNLAQAAP